MAYQQRTVTRTRINILQTCSVAIIIILVVGGLVFNYFYSHKYLDDYELQWRVYMYTTTLSLFFFALYMYLGEVKRKRKYTAIACGWLCFWMFFNTVGVFLGYNLHSNGFVSLLFLTAFLGLCHIVCVLCRKYFL